MAENWRIVAQQQREELTPQGTFQKVWDVTYETVSGTRGTITIPERLYSEDYVHSAVNAQVSTILAVERL